ncbi:MAG: hypothetical protein WDN24_01075 [Sphingomonas sp.]
MQPLPMDVPAEIHRWAYGEGTGQPCRSEIVVARGPLVIMAHGLMALDPSFRRDCWITGAFGDLTAEDAEEALRRWAGERPG